MVEKRRLGSGMEGVWWPRLCNQERYKVFGRQWMQIDDHVRSDGGSLIACARCLPCSPHGIRWRSLEDAALQFIRSAWVGVTPCKLNKDH